MKRANIFLSKFTQQSVLTKSGSISVFAQSGVKAKSSREGSVIDKEKTRFVVGGSVVGGDHKVRG